MPMPKGHKVADKPMSVKHKVFAEAYVQMGGGHGVQGEAYMRAYPNVSSKSVAAVNATRLLRSAKVQEYIRQLRQESTERTGLSLDWATQEMRRLYNAAMNDSDYNAAGNALNMIMKHLGGYETHNTQKHRYNQEDVERLKNELKEKGFNLDRLNDRSEN